MRQVERGPVLTHPAEAQALELEAEEAHRAIGGYCLYWLSCVLLTAFYHRKLPSQPPALEPFLREVEDCFALGEYSTALLAGSLLPEPRRSRDRRKASLLDPILFT